MRKKKRVETKLLYRVHEREGENVILFKKKKKRREKKILLVHCNSTCVRVLFPLRAKFARIFDGKEKEKGGKTYSYAETKKKEETK
jgi:hypothetical protein